jgi:beta-N-acetylhexosaminidase
MSVKGLGGAEVSAGQLLLVGFRPEEEQKILSLVCKAKLGGLILFGRNASDAKQVIRLSREIKESLKGCPPHATPLIAVDQEQGRICRILDGVTRFPGASRLGAINRPGTTERTAQWVGRELAALGIHLNLAPVGDVLTRVPTPSLLEGRTFGEDPTRVARHVRAWIQGSQKGGIAACAKHFPGHGSVEDDSHFKMPRDRTPLDVMRRLHLKPFMSAVRSGVAVIMMSHVAYDALDPNMPASLSEETIVGLLRSEMGFQGLVLTDDLEMEAVSEHGNPVDLAVEAINAGGDMALIGRNLKAVVEVEDLISGVEEAVARERLTRERYTSAVKRVLAFKREWIPSHWAPPSYAPPYMGARRLSKRLWSEESL